MLVTREVKGSKLTIPEMDGNLLYLEGLGLKGSNYVFVSANGTNIENAAELLAAYNLAKTMSPSITNRITVVAALGNYNFGSTAFVMDTQYIDLVSLDGNKSIVFNSANSAGTINITANDVFVKGVDVGTKSFLIGDNLNLLKLENCKGGASSFGKIQIISGTFTNCIGGNRSFGFQGTASGIFTNCVGGSESFGSVNTASGTFTNCIGGSGSFGGQGTASGVFNNCTGTGSSFGATYFYSGLPGTCVSCTSDLYGSLSGKLYFCRQTSNGNALPVISANSAGKIVAFITKDNNFIAQQP